MYEIDLTFFINNDTLKRLTFFTMADISLLLITLIVLVGIFYFKRSQRTEDYYKNYMPNLFFKLFFAFACSIFFIVVVKG
jgi:zinc transporter ZupT